MLAEVSDVPSVGFVESDSQDIHDLSPAGYESHLNLRFFTN